MGSSRESVALGRGVSTAMVDSHGGTGVGVSVGVGEGTGVRVGAAVRVGVPEGPGVTVKGGVGVMVKRGDGGGVSVIARAVGTRVGTPATLCAPIGREDWQATSGGAARRKSQTTEQSRRRRVQFIICLGVAMALVPSESNFMFSSESYL